MFKFVVYSVLALIAVVWLGIFSKSDGEAVSRHAEASDQQTAEFLWQERGKDAVRELLKDPDSAEFRNVHFSRGQDDIPMTCGEVNARNSFGGYAGYQHFISGGRPELTFINDGSIQDFRALWDRYCVAP